jgi:hypothetical protein
MLRFSEKKGKGKVVDFLKNNKGKLAASTGASLLAGAFMKYLRGKHGKSVYKEEDPTGDVETAKTEGGRKKGKGAFTDFVKKHKGKIGLAAGVLGTAATIGMALHNRKPDTQKANVHRIPPAIRDNPLGAILQEHVPHGRPIGRPAEEEEMKINRPESSLLRPHPPALPPRRRRGTKVQSLASFLSGDGKKKKMTKKGKGAFMDFIKKHKKKLGIAAGITGALGTAALGAHLYNRKPTTPRIEPSSIIRHPSGFNIRNPAEFYEYEDV